MSVNQIIQENDILINAALESQEIGRHHNSLRLIQLLESNIISLGTFINHQMSTNAKFSSDETMTLDLDKPLYGPVHIRNNKIDLELVPDKDIFPQFPLPTLTRNPADELWPTQNSGFPFAEIDTFSHDFLMNNFYSSDPLGVQPTMSDGPLKDSITSSMQTAQNRLLKLKEQSAPASAFIPFEQNCFERCSHDEKNQFKDFLSDIFTKFHVDVYHGTLVRPQMDVTTLKQSHQTPS
ncbi:hypothetical protein BLNAU_4501 [Blattamonas nauphoetae]|uniref:Uncharacterized protein n=1 Tax=Blattamonas nauphoetae TaxID=2049346 RepID=A0ABQ9YA10_9EUKA|nr:hypothetical protein BLNAU_4501 [Blattamonas nauphoetae]